MMMMTTTVDVLEYNSSINSKMRLKDKNNFDLAFSKQDNQFNNFVEYHLLLDQGYTKTVSIAV